MSPSKPGFPSMVSKTGHASSTLDRATLARSTVPAAVAKEPTTFFWELPPAQTQINNELRDVMERDVMEQDIMKRKPKSIPVDYSLLLNNRTFIRAVAEEVAEYRAEGGEVADQADV